MNRYALIAAAGLLAGAIAGFVVRDLWADTELATVKADHAEQLQQIATERDAQARRAMQAAIDAEAVVAKIDQTNYEDLRRAQAEIESLRAAVRAGDRRLSIKATCPAGRASVPEATGTAGVGDGAGRADIDPGAAERIVALTERGDRAIRQLAACQEYARTVTN